MKRLVLKVVDVNNGHLESERQAEQLRHYSDVADTEWLNFLVNLDYLDQILEDHLIGQPAKDLLTKLKSEGHEWVYFTSTGTIYDDLPVYDW